MKNKIVKFLDNVGIILSDEKVIIGEEKIKCYPVLFGASIKNLCFINKEEIPSIFSYNEYMEDNTKRIQGSDLDQRTITEICFEGIDTQYKIFRYKGYYSTYFKMFFCKSRNIWDWTTDLQDKNERDFKSILKILKDNND